MDKDTTGLHLASILGDTEKLKVKNRMQDIKRQLAVYGIYALTQNTVGYGDMITLRHDGQSFTGEDEINTYLSYVSTPDLTNL